MNIEAPKSLITFFVWAFCLAVYAIIASIGWQIGEKIWSFF